MSSIKKPPLPRHNVISRLPEFYCLNYFSELKKSNIQNALEAKERKQNLDRFEKQLHDWLSNN